MRLIDELAYIYNEADLTAVERDNMPFYMDGSLEFLFSTAFEKLFEYFAFEVVEMPYGVAKARTGCPDEWILERLEGGV